MRQIVIILSMFFLAFLFAGISLSSDPVVVEFLWYEPCELCPGMEEYFQVYLHNSEVVSDIENDYGSEVMVDWIEIYSAEGVEKMEYYNLSLGDWNTIIVDYEIIFKGGNIHVNETEIRQVIDTLLSPPPVHDIAVLGIETSNRSVEIGDTLTINITVRNEGTQIETFNVTANYDSSIIQTLLVENLEPEAESLLNIQWNTTNITAGNYTINVFAEIIQNETDIDDNNREYGIIEVRTPYTPPTIRHDIAIISIDPSPIKLEVGKALNITVTVLNNGTETENFNVSTYHGETLIETLYVNDLDPNKELSLNSLWDTTDQTSGNYTLNARVPQITNETSLENNYLVFGQVELIEPPSPLLEMFMVAFSAFSLGFLETFSPCLIIMLSFILGYSIGETTEFKRSFTKVMIFGIGFVLAAVLLGLIFVLVFLSLPMLQFSLTLIVCIFAIVFGLNLLGILRVPIDTTPITKRIARKYVVTLAGLFTLGFIFYFLDPCVAVILPTLVPLLSPSSYPLILFMFSIGAIVPFIGIGVFAGSISKLTRRTYRHRAKIRALSGLILIGYAIYLIIFYLPKLFT